MRTDKNNIDFMCKVSVPPQRTHRHICTPSSSLSDFILFYFTFVLKPKEEKYERNNTKGRFPIQYATNAGSWIHDKAWKNIANPAASQHVVNLERREFKKLEDRKKQKIL